MSQIMPFTDQAVVETCTKFIDSLEKPACNCNAGVRMCKHTPCIGTVDDIEKLINAGYAKNLMLDWWVGEDSGVRKMNKIFNKDEEPEESPQLFKRKIKSPGQKMHKENPFTEDVPYLVPAVVGYGGKRAAFVKTGACNLLVNNQCSVHDLDLKPVQGRMACCKISRVFIDENGKQQDLDERIPILHTWNTQRGKDLIEKWKKEVGFVEDGEDEAPIPKTTGDLIEALLGILGSHVEMYEPNADGTPIHDDRPIKTLTYEKPY